MSAPGARGYRGERVTVYFPARRPLHARGDSVVRTADGEVRLKRATLCACGWSANPPFCDLSHRAG